MNNNVFGYFVAVNALFLRHTKCNCEAVKNERNKHLVGIADVIKLNVLLMFFTIRVFMLLASQLNSASICVQALHYSSLLGGFAVVLSNGRAAFLTASSLKFEPSVSGVTMLQRVLL